MFKFPNATENSRTETRIFVRIINNHGRRSISTYPSFIGLKRNTSDAVAKKGFYKTYIVYTSKKVTYTRVGQ